MKIPMRKKYVDEAVGVWMVFGEHADGSVDVSDQSRDAFQALSRETAEKVVALQAEFLEKLYGVLCHGQED